MSQELVVKEKAKSLRSLLEASKDQIAMALPAHLKPERLLRIAMTEAQSNPALLDCSKVSFIGAIIKAATLGLEPGGALGHCYLLPFKNKNTNTTEVQFIVGYRGMIDLAYRSPKVKKIVARAVYEKDKFSYDFGLDEKLTHVPNQAGEGEKLTHVYCIVEMENGVKMFDVMTRVEIEGARSRSKASESGPWKSDYEAMAKKSVVRRFFKFMPSSIELQQAVGMDEAADRGEQHNGAIIEAVGVHVQEKPATTDRLKEQLGSAPASQKMAEEPAPTFQQSDEPNGSFENFDQTHVAAKKTYTQASHADLILEVSQAAKAAGLKDLKALSARCMKDFNKITGDMTPEELEVLLIALEKEKK